MEKEFFYYRIIELVQPSSLKLKDITKDEIKQVKVLDSKFKEAKVNYYSVLTRENGKLTGIEIVDEYEKFLIKNVEKDNKKIIMKKIEENGLEVVENKLISLSTGNLNYLLNGEIGDFIVRFTVDDKKKYDLVKSKDVTTKKTQVISKSKTDKSGIFSYPYNFISLGNANIIEENRHAIKFGKNSGRLICSMENLTPIFTAGKVSKSDVYVKGEKKEHTKEDFLEYKKDWYVIPASSLKGTIRNVIEVITTSCIKGVDLDKAEKAIKKDEVVKSAFHSCSSMDRLCFACRLFGSTGNDKAKDNDMNLFLKEIEKGDNKKNSYMGRIKFSDALLGKNTRVISNYIILKNLSSPSIDKIDYYFTKEKEIRGRKFYWHHSDKINTKDETRYLTTITATRETPSNISIKYIKPNNKFTFEVEFNNLTDEELGVLIYALELEKGLAHKVGKAKAFGFGSCKITITEFLLDSAEKYTSFTSTYKKGDKEKFLKIVKDKYLDNRVEILELKNMLSIEEKNGLDFSNSPFPNPANLKEIKKKIGKEKFKLPEILDYTPKGN